MSDPSHQPVPADLLELLRQVAAASQQVARSLAQLEGLYAEELRRREEQRQEQAAERGEWKERLKRSEDERHQREQEWERRAWQMPTLPWPFRVFLGLVVLVLLLATGVLGVYLIRLIQGDTP
jgi:hypothetical protein